MDFKQALGAFFAGDMDVASLQRALADELTTRPENSDALITDLERRYKLGRLPVQLYSMLRSQIETTTGQHSAAPPADDATRIRAPRTPPAPPAQPPPAPPQAASDHTQLGAPPRGRPDATVLGTSKTSTQATSRPGTSPSSGFKATGSSWGEAEQWAAGETPALTVGAVLKQRFVLEAVLGQGGMGTVYRARDLRYEEAEDRNPYVALKVLGEEFKRHPKSLVALHREARKSQSLAHPNIVTVYDFDRDGGVVYLTMELLEGRPLNKLISEHKLTGVPKAQALSLISDMGRALSYAHKKNIIHSDFKPANAFVTNEDIVKVLDFGIARAAPKRGEVQEEKTRFDVRQEIGGMTLAYASPEMLEDLEPDPRDDIYALACTSYELLSGRHPFGKMSALQALEADIEPKPLKTITRREWKALRHGLEFQRERRTPSVDQFLEELMPRRRQTGLLIGVAVTGGVAVSVIAGTLIMQRIQQNRIGNLQEELLSGDQARRWDAIQALEHENADIQSRVLIPKVHQPVLETFDTEVDQRVKAYEFKKAIEEIAQLEGLLPTGVPELKAKVEKELNQARVDLHAKYDEQLAAGNLLPVADQDDITDVIEKLQSVEEFAPAKDQQLLDAYRDRAQKVAESAKPDLALARRLIEQGLSYQSADPRLTEYLSVIDLKEKDQQRLASVQTLEQQLSTSAPATIDDFRRSRDDIGKLAGLAPDSVGLAKLRAGARNAVDSEIKTRIAARDWTGARNTLGEFAAILDPSYSAAAGKQVDDAERAHADRVSAVYAALERSAQANKFEDAARQLQQLSAEGADADTLQRGRDVLARRHLALAQAARGTKNWNGARDLVNKGLAYQPSEAVKDSLNVELGYIKDGENGVVIEIQTQIAQQAQAFEQILQSPTFDLKAARSAQSALDALAGIDSKNALLTTGPDRIGARLAEEARRMSVDNRFDDAIAFATKAREVVPQSADVANVLKELGDARQHAASAAKVEQLRNAALAAMEQQSRHLDDATWDGKVQAALRTVESQDADFARTNRSKVAASLLAAATARREAQKLPEADALLTRANAFDKQLPGLDTEARLIAEARAQIKDESDRLAKAGALEKRKQNVLALAGALQVANARRELDAVSQQLDAADPFLTQDAPKAMAGAYQKLGSAASRERQYDRALKFVDDGLHYQPDDAQLKSDRGLYQRDGEVYAIETVLGAAAPLDVAAVKKRIDAVRTSETPDRLRDIEARWRQVAQSGVREQAETDVAGATKRRDDELRDLFPGDKGLAALTIEAPVVVTTVPPPPPPTETPTPTPAPPEEETKAETKPEENVPADPCTHNLRGYGTRMNYTCHDKLGSGSGPVLVVVPGASQQTDYAMSKYEITVGDYNLYCTSSSRCSPLQGDAALPVTGISIDDARAYATWLSDNTKFRYRIPTPSEWQHAAGADGSEIPDKNCKLVVNGKTTIGKELQPAKTAMGQNAWGLVAPVGNAQEWVIDGNRIEAVGGAYTDNTATCNVKLAKPHDGKPDNTTGFRLLRELRG